MLTCEQVTARASALQDAELGLRERLAIRLHFVICRKCRAFARRLRALRGRLATRAAGSQGPVSDAFIDRVLHAIEHRHPDT
ncbi:MAG: zf-HC2 domain-containing protein [Pseudomonadales bacterium]